MILLARARLLVGRKLLEEQTKRKRNTIKIPLIRDTFETPNNESLNQMNIREWFNREFPSDLDLMLQQNGKSLR